MQTTAQLELNLWQQLEAANHQPEAADLRRLWQGLEQALTFVSQEQQLQVAAQAIAQIAQVFCLRADLVLAALEASDNSQGPVLSEDFLNGLMRQSMTIDVTDLKEELLGGPEPLTRQRQASSSTAGDSIVGEVSKEALLEAFDSEIELVEAQAKAQSAVVAVAHDEDVVGWSRAIAKWFADQETAKPVSLIQLQQSLGLPMVEVWMGLLLSPQQRYDLEQKGEFYEADGIYLKHKSPISQA